MAVSQDNLTGLARQADAICEVTKPLNAVTCHAVTTKETTVLEAKIDALQQAVEALNRRSPSRRVDRNHTPERRFRSISPGRPGKNICYYHRHFGIVAFRCTKPCSFDATKTKEN